MHSNAHRSTIYSCQIQKQPKYPLTDEWVKKMQYVYTMDYYTAMKKNEIVPFATKMDLEGIILS